MKGMVFISYCSKDIEFVNFLVLLLKNHYIKVYCYEIDCEKGKDFSKEIEEALDNSYTLIIVISSKIKGLTRAWIEKEITYFYAKHPEADIIPLFIENTNIHQLDKIMPGLSKYNGIDFSNYRLYSGFKELLAKFGKKLLDTGEQRSLPDRRTTKERRAIYERRKDIIRRLQHSLWEWYSETYNYEKDKYIYLNIDELYDLRKAIYPHFNNLLCLNKDNSQYNNLKVIDKSIHQVWDFFKENVFPGSKLIRAKDITDAIAENINNNYIIQYKDRRENPDRRSGLERRDNDYISGSNYRYLN